MQHAGIVYWDFISTWCWHVPSDLIPHLFSLSLSLSYCWQSFYKKKSNNFIEKRRENTKGKKAHGRVLETTGGKKKVTMKVQKSSISSKEIKVKTPVAFAQSNKVWKKRSFNSWIDLSFPSKLRTFLPPNDSHKTMRDHSPKHLRSEFVECVRSTCQKFYNTMRHDPMNLKIFFFLG